MSRFEIVHLRSSREIVETLRDRIIDTLKDQGSTVAKISLYRRDGLETDVAVHISPIGSEPEGLPSEIGLHLAAELRTYGLVEHSVWEELE
ncbi:MAG: hypothetical protein GY906_34440 [bacterium]|nr:hypothetical protein [bacterium]